MEGTELNRIHLTHSFLGFDSSYNPSNGAQQQITVNNDTNDWRGIGQDSSPS